jgi:predicted Zn-dependent peptidase
MKTKKKQPDVRLHTVHGYTVVLMTTSTQMIAVQCGINSGFVHETQETSGVNHLLEHVLTDSWTKCGTNCSEYWNKKGVVMNASTDETMLKYFTNGLEEDLVEMVDYIITISDHPTFKHASFVQEKEAVIDELLTYGRDPESKVDDVFNKNFYTEPGLQYKDDWKLQIKNLKTLTEDDMKAAYNEHYNTKNTVFLVSGAFNPRRVLSIFEQKLKKKQGGVACEPYCFSNVHKILYLKHESPTTVLVLGFPSDVLLHEEDASYISPIIHMVDNILFDTLRTKHRLIYSTDMSPTSNTCGTVVRLKLYIRDINIVNCMRLVSEVFTHYTTHPFPVTAMRAAKKVELAHFYTAVDTGANYLLQMVAKIPTDSTKVFTLSERMAAVKSMDAATATRVFNRLFRLNRSLCVYQGGTDVHLKF